MSSKTSTKRRHTRAGLNFPVTIVRRYLKERMPQRRLAKHVEVFITGAMEKAVQQWLEDSTVRVTKRTHIEAKQLMEALNDPKSMIAGLFPKNATGLYLDEKE